MTITKQDFTHSFRAEVSSMPGGELAARCFDCGTCTGVCPVSEAEPAFDPRKIIHMIRMGLKDQLLGSEAIWFCSHCDTCAFVCPQEVVFSNVIDVLREMAIKEGYVGPGAFQVWASGPCKASCPAHISIGGFIAAISQGKYLEGLKLIKREMPFPAICGRVCPHPCEMNCNRAGIDKPVAIEGLKRFLADADLFSDISYTPEKKDEKSQKVVIVGAGPAGLTAAYYLAIEGYPVTVFERLPVAGGMMAVGIPEFRLPRRVLQAEVDKIKELGVEIRLNVEIGKDVTFEALKKDYDAVFIAIGCHHPIKIDVEGEDELKGVIDGITFLRDIHLGRPTLLKEKAVVIGGGNTAVDSARVAKRLGFQEVSILYRRTREEMPAISYEVDEAIEEGIQIEFLTSPTKIMGKDGEVCALECMRMKLGEPDESGRRKPIPIERSEFEVKTDVVITAIGQQPELGPLSREGKFATSKQGLIMVDPKTGETNVPGIFAAGDVVSGPRTVVEAVGFGKEVAMSIDLLLRGEDPKAARRGEWQGMEFRPEHVQARQRVDMPRISLSERQRSFKEIDLGFSEQEAKAEAERCLMLCGIQRARK